jgi:hypothetical protein
VRGCFKKERMKSFRVIRKVFNGIAVNYMQVDRSKSVNEIKHKMNVKTAIFGELHHPYNDEMNFIQ